MKTSPADLSVMEFLDISNMDFTVSGALQQRPGTGTFLLGSAASLNLSYGVQEFSYSLGIGPQAAGVIAITSPSFVGGNISSVYEFSNLQGSSFIMFSAPGNFGAFTATFSFGFAPGYSLLYVSAPSISLMQIYYSLGSTFAPLLDQNLFNSSITLPSNPNWCFSAFVNRVFFCNGDSFFKWDGNFAQPALSYNISAQWNFYPPGQSLNSLNVLPEYLPVPGSLTLCINTFAYKYCLPPGTSLFFNATLGFGSSLTFTSQTYTYSYGFINERGFLGPVSSPVTVGGLGTSLGVVVLYGFSTPLLSGFSIPSGFGIGTSIISYDYTGISTGEYTRMALYRDNGPGTGRYLIEYNYEGYSGLGSISATPSVILDLGIPTSTTPEPTCIYATLAPQFLEIFNNQMFMCGFSQAPSTVQFSDIGEPESIQPQNNFDFRTNDGDYLTGMKAAFQQLFLFKNKSFAALSGDNPQDFSLNILSDQYGCISNRATATYQTYLMFLDKKGIALYNGAQVQIASTKIDPIFATMNIPAAKNNAWMLHNKQRNQIWTGIPVNGSTLINKVIIYDYLLNAWTHFDGLNISSAAIAFGSQQQPTVYWGGYSSYLGYFSPSLTSDFGATITMYAQSRFFCAAGQSVEMMWRRLTLNTLSVLGATNLWNIALFANYASLPSVTFIQGGMSFQSRSDFGVTAKALSIYFSSSTATDTLTFQGMTVESRFQRNN